jgi:hypothetical protein
MTHRGFAGSWNLVGTVKQPDRPFLCEVWLPLIGKTFEFCYTATVATQGTTLAQNYWIIHEKHHHQLTNKQIGYRFLEDEIEFVSWKESSNSRLVG